MPRLGDPRTGAALQRAPSPPQFFAPRSVPPEQVAASLRDHGFAFLFAPGYHPAFRHIMPARKLCADRGQRTVFNFLGSLPNPARPTSQLIGVPKGELCEPISRVLQSLGIRRGVVVNGKVGDSAMDELSTLGENTVAEFYQDRGFSVSRNEPSLFPLQSATLDDLKGGDAGENAATIRAILAGEEARSLPWRVVTPGSVCTCRGTPACLSAIVSGRVAGNVRHSTKPDASNCEGAHTRQIGRTGTSGWRRRAWFAAWAGTASCIAAWCCESRYCVRPSRPVSTTRAQRAGSLIQR